MKQLYGMLIIFFYFVKYPIVIYVPLSYYVLKFPSNWVMNVLWVVSVVLILKDIFFPHDKEKS